RVGHFGGQLVLLGPVFLGTDGAQMDPHFMGADQHALPAIGAHHLEVAGGVGQGVTLGSFLGNKVDDEVGHGSAAASRGPAYRHKPISGAARPERGEQKQTAYSQGSSAWSHPATMDA